MALENQVNLYSVDTGNFYTKKERALHNKNAKIRAERKIIAEKLMIDGEAPDLQDYKFYCFDGKPVYCQVIGSRSTDETIDFFDMEWNHMPFIGLITKNSHETFSNTQIPRPKTLDQMIEAAKIMSGEFSFVRVDLYEINGRMYFGEMTFTPASGGGKFRPDEMDFEMGKMLKVNGE